MIGSAYLSPPGYEAVLTDELSTAGAAITAWHGRLALSPNPPVHAAWALDVWTSPHQKRAETIGAAVAALRAVQRNWSSYLPEQTGRGGLIEARLPPVKARALVFPEPAPASHLGAWTLLAPDRLLFSATKTSPFVGGEPRFEEDHIGPPSRAYLKLWEALTRMGAYPRAGDRCIDLGAAPGGWTWALARLGASVLAVDRAPLDERVTAMPGVVARAGNALTMPPEPADWLVSDVIAYPDKLLPVIRAWIESGLVRNVVCTIKLQGATGHEAVRGFYDIPGGTVAHLFHNRHELTLMWRREPTSG